MSTTSNSTAPTPELVSAGPTPSLTEIRRHLHMNPELGFNEFNTSSLIRRTLESEGFVVNGPVADTGLYVDIEGSGPGRCVAYRADIDALPIQDAKDVEYGSTIPGVAHLCGHDAHTAVGIGVARAIRERSSDFAGTVRVFFQPNEEGNPSGAPRMIEDGILDGVDRAYCIHVDPSLPVGTYGLKEGPITAGSCVFNIAIRADKTGHTARPHEAVDTVWISTQILNTLFQLAGRLQDARNPAVIAVGRIHGGTATNVIPDLVEIGGTLRCTSKPDLDKLAEYLKTTTIETATRFGATAEVEILGGCPPVVGDGKMVAIARDAVISAHGADGIYEIPRPSMGAEDFAYYQLHRPGLLVRVGTSSGPETSFPLHNANFDIDESAMPLAVDLMSDILIRDLQVGA